MLVVMGVAEERDMGITKKSLDMRHPEEAFQIAVVYQGLLVVPCTGKFLGVARLDFFCNGRSFNLAAGFWCFCQGTLFNDCCRQLRHHLNIRNMGSPE